MFRSVLLAIALLVAAMPAALQAQRNHIIDRWRVEDGLPNHALADVLQTRDGYLWIATWAGTTRFDGIRFSPLGVTLPNDHARVIFEDRDGAVWIGVAGTGLARWRDGHVDTYTPAEGLAGHDVRAIVQDAGGRIWAGTEAGVTIIGGDAMVTLRIGNGLPHDMINHLAPAGDGGVWVATQKGLCKATAHSGRCTIEPAIGEGIDVVLEDRTGRLWLGTTTGLAVARGEHACAPRCLQDTAITALLETKDGSLWAGLGTTGVAHLDGQDIQRFAPGDRLPSGTVVALHEDSEGSVWIASYNGGLARIKAKRVTTLSTDDGLTATVIGSIVQDRHGDIWAGAQCGPVSVLRNGRFVPQFADRMPGVCAWSVWAARDGALWIGTRGSGLYRSIDGRLDHFGAAEGLSDPHIDALFEDRDGTIWIGTEFGGVHQFRDGKLSRAFTAADGVATGYVASFAQDREGRVWIGSNANGLSVYEHGRFRTLPPEDSPPTRSIAGLLVDSRGDLWIGSAASGLFRRRNGKYEPFGVEQGLGDRLVAMVVEDRDANLWVGTARGISRLSRERIEAVADGRASSLDPIVLDRADGMRNAEGSGGGHDPSGLRDRDGRLWFATIDGIAVIDPATFTTNQLPPKIVVEHTLIDERPLARRADGAIEIPPGISSVEIGYTAFSFVAPEKVRFRHRLVGFEETWHEVGGRRAAYYSRLPPGEYTLEVVASNNDGVWSATPAMARVVVLPFFWERQPVRLAGLALLLLITGAGVYGVVQRRTRRRIADIEREHALERERTRIARDLHDDLGSRLARIALMADRGAATDRVSTAVRMAVESLDELVWMVNARHDTVEGFAAYAAHFAEEHVGAANLRLRLHIPADLPALELPAETRRDLYLSFKEAINNAVKHARSQEIQVVLGITGSTVQLEVIDDGQGLRGGGDPTGNGMINMTERMAAIGGSVEWLSPDTGGLRVVLRAPLANGRPGGMNM